MKQLSINEINSIPFMNRSKANEIAIKALSDDYDLNNIIGFLPFFDVDIANNILKEALKKNDNIEVLLMAINPFIDKYINDAITQKAMKNCINAEMIVGKVFPFVSIAVANKVAEYAINNDCNSESLINAAMPFVNREMADKVVLYAIEKKTDPEFLSMKVFPFVSQDIKCDLNGYIANSACKSRPMDDISNRIDSIKTENIKKLEKIFRESGVALDVEKTDENLGMDSLHYISIICEMENEFGVEIPNEVFSENKLFSFNDFLQLLTSLKEE